MGTQQTAKTVTNITSKIKASKTGIKLAQALFSGNALSLSPTQITSLLKATGIEIPNGVIIGADIAQILISGGCFVDDIATASEIGQVCEAGDIASIGGAVLGILVATGAIDAKGSTYYFVKTGVDTFAVVASSGTDVIADINLFLDIAMPSITLYAAFNHDETKEIDAYINRRASERVQSTVSSWITREQAATRFLFEDYQKGHLGIFDFFYYVSYFAPDLFTRVFPNMANFFPETDIKVCDTESDLASTSITSVKRLETTKCLTFKTLKTISKTDFQEVLFRKMVAENFEIYRYLEGTPNKISLLDLAALSLLPPYFSDIGPGFDVTKTLLRNNLVPADLGYSVFELAYSKGLFGTAQAKRTSGAITFNGVDYLDSTIQHYNKEVDETNYHLQLVKYYEEKRDIKGLCSIPEVKKLLREWGDLTTVRLPVGLKVKLDEKGKPSYLNIQNFWSAISVLNDLLNDPFFSENASYKTTANEMYKTVQDFIPSITDLEERHKYIQFIGLARGMNQKAKANIASYFGKTLNQVDVIMENGLAKVVPKQKLGHDLTVIAKETKPALTHKAFFQTIDATKDKPAIDPALEENLLKGYNDIYDPGLNAGYRRVPGIYDYATRSDQ